MGNYHNKQRFDKLQNLGLCVNVVQSRSHTYAHLAKHMFLYCLLSAPHTGNGRFGHLHASHGQGLSHLMVTPLKLKAIYV